MPTYHDLSATDKMAYANAPDTDPVPEGVPTSGGTGSTAWEALGSKTGEQIIFLVCKDGVPMEDQPALQTARLNGLPLPAGSEVLVFDRRSTCLVVMGNLDSAASDLRAAGFPDAVVRPPIWVLLRYEDIA